MGIEFSVEFGGIRFLGLDNVLYEVWKVFPWPVNSRCVICKEEIRDKSFIGTAAPDINRNFKNYHLACFPYLEELKIKLVIEKLKI